jgi:hypothetical protein
MANVLSRLVSDPSDVSEFVRQGRRQLYGAGTGPTGSIFLDLGGSLLGGKGYKGAAYERFTRPILNVDEALGRGPATHAPGALKKLFLKRELYDVPGASFQGMPLKALRESPSLTEPLMKVKNVALPLVAAIAVSGWLTKRRREKKRQQMINQYLSETYQPEQPT